MDVAGHVDMNVAPSHRVVAIDVGGMSIKRGVVDLSPGGPAIDVLAPSSLDAAAAADEVLFQLHGAIDSVLSRVASPAAAAPVSLGVAFPGPMDYVRGIPYLRGQRKFDSLYDVDLRAWAKTAWPDLSIDVRFINDAEAAALGESIAGAARGSARSLTVTLGTGFGAAAVIDGCAQSEVGAVDIGQLFRHQVDGLGRADDVLSATGLARLCEVAADAVPRAAAEARRGDVELRHRWVAFGRRLGRFLNTVTASMQLEVIVTGGGAANAFDLFGPALADESRVRVQGAELGARAALLGAASPWLSSSP